MVRFPFLLFALTVLTFGFAQRSVVLAGVVDSADPLPEGTRVAVQVLDADSAWTLEAGSAVPIGGSFRVDLDTVPDELLREFRSGGVLLPGLQNEYRVEPEGVRFVQGALSMYVDADENGVWTNEPERDPYFLALAQLEAPIGFFSLLYVDRPATVQGAGVELQLEVGWNAYTVRFPETGPEYRVFASVDDVVIEVLDLLPR